MPRRGAGNQGRHRDLPLLVGWLAYCQPIPTVDGKKIWDMLRARARAWEIDIESGTSGNPRTLFHKYFHEFP
jgi:hypothetical protein